MQIQYLFHEYEADDLGFNSQYLSRLSDRLFFNGSALRGLGWELSSSGELGAHAATTPLSSLPPPENLRTL
jgi:hypothetical protein